MKFNIGGLVVDIEEQHVAKIPYLHKILENASTNAFKTVRDEENNIYIERTPMYFAYILEYIRYGTLPESFTDEIKEELHFYGIILEEYSDEYLDIIENEFGVRNNINTRTLTLHEVFGTVIPHNRSEFPSRCGITEDDLLLKIAYTGNVDKIYTKSMFLSHLSTIAGQIPSAYSDERSKCSIIYDILALGNIALCGGFVSSILSNVVTHDLDFFIYDCSEEHAMGLLREINTLFGPGTTLKIRSEHCITFIHNRMRFQFILRIYRDKSHILLGFDLDASCFMLVLDNGFKLLASNRGLHALRYRINCVNFKYLSSSYEYRLIKYAQRGFAVYVPRFRRSLIYARKMNYEITYLSKKYEASYVQGLEMLLRVDRTIVNNIPCESYIQHVSDYDEGIDDHPENNAKRLIRFSIGSSKYLSTYITNKYMIVNDDMCEINEALEHVKLKTVSSYSLTDLIDIHGSIVRHLGFSPAMKFMIDDPMKQFIGSFHALTLDNTDVWYRDMIRLW